MHKTCRGFQNRRKVTFSHILLAIHANLNSDGSTGSDGFAAALMMIAGLPLPDADKSDAVKHAVR